jgi:hypothetical protein
VQVLPVATAVTVAPVLLMGQLAAYTSMAAMAAKVVKLVTH